MSNVFVRNTVIDKNKIKSVVEARKNFTEEALREDWDIVHETFKDDNLTLGDKEDFNYVDMYLICFNSNLSGLSLDDLEYIKKYNLFAFDPNSMLDYKCKVLLAKKIEEYQKKINELSKFMYQGKPENYFLQGLKENSEAPIADIFRIQSNFKIIYCILGLEKENVELTPLGEELKAYMDAVKRNSDEIISKLVDPGTDLKF